jgi:hypothetical protein
MEAQPRANREAVTAMALTINDDSISGDHTQHTARLVPGPQGAWEVSWLPGRPLNRSAAITAMVLADMAATRAPQPGDGLWPHVEVWATAVGLTAPEALARVSQPPGGISAGHDSATPSDPEAAG